MDFECFLSDPRATEAAAAAVAGRCRVGDIFCLYGDLGAGKTAFARGFLRALGVEDDIPSPTFNLLLTYETPAGLVWHFDLYRLNQPEEAEELGLDDAFADGISLIEWPERLGSWLPEQRIDINLADANGGAARHLQLQARGTGAERWRGLW